MASLHNATFYLRDRALRLAFAALCALGVLLATVWGATPAEAESNAVYTATATPHYQHPGTGAIEDSGGEASLALGQSMTESATYPAALVEYDAAGTPYVTLRLMLMDNISDVSISADPDWSGSFYGLGYNVTQSTDTTSDFQVQEDPSVVFRIQMYVSPMGRYVVFYVTLSDLAEGNPDGFAQTVDTSDTSADAGDGEASTPAQTPVASAQTSAATASVTQAAAASGEEGIQEYDADGNPGDGSGTGTVSVSVVGLVAGIVAGILIGIVSIALVAGLVVWAFVLRHRAQMDRASVAALAAAAAPQAGAAQPSGCPGAPQAGAASEPSPAPENPSGATGPDDDLDETSVMPLPRPPKDADDALS